MLLLDVSLDIGNDCIWGNSAASINYEEVSRGWEAGETHDGEVPNFIEGVDDGWKLIKAISLNRANSQITAVPIVLRRCPGGNRWKEEY